MLCGYGYRSEKNDSEAHFEKALAEEKESRDRKDRRVEEGFVIVDKRIFEKLLCNAHKHSMNI